MSDLQKKYERALMEIEKLRQENMRLQAQLIKLTRSSDIQGGPVEPPHPPQPYAGQAAVHRFSSVEEKLALFGSLFRGREDVYPIRWEGKQGRAGYSPACANEWTSVCRKPQVKCSACSHQHFLPVTNEVLYKHLDARENRTVGVYPMLKDENCWFLAMDFDKEQWQEDAAAVMQICGEQRIPAALERSRSGNGGHIWLFFEKPVEASTGRKLGAILLMLSMNRRYQLGLDSFDRMFPILRRAGWTRRPLIDCGAWLRSRTRTSIRLKRCECRPTASQG
ncbi:TOTE conflict system archaeo-eukaryotic primase domain-containing protein [Cohnella fermenti]|uniref:TOTE conflict system archaeo-eukaryotic primase domain-containing protein n=1 Tax=Cohnella fermenti TaxID=2565925 RepID=UPI001E35F12E|nr:hypothetical protein [Cohnella fermenti]